MIFGENWTKKGRGLLQIYFNGKILGTFSRLIGHQRGLSIYPLGGEKSICEDWTVSDT